MKTYWTTEHYPDAVPIDLYELAKAMDYNSKLHLKPKRRFITMEGIRKYIEHFTQFSINVDAYRFYDQTFEHTIQIGVRYGNEDYQHSSILLKREIADRFRLDPLNKDKPYEVIPIIK